MKSSPAGWSWLLREGRVHVCVAADWILSWAILSSRLHAVGPEGSHVPSGWVPSGRHLLWWYCCLLCSCSFSWKCHTSSCSDWIKAVPGRLFREDLGFVLLSLLPLLFPPLCRTSLSFSPTTEQLLTVWRSALRSDLAHELCHPAHGSFHESGNLAVGEVWQC